MKTKVVHYSRVWIGRVADKGNGICSRFHTRSRRIENAEALVENALAAQSNACASYAKATRGSMLYDRQDWSDSRSARRKHELGTRAIPPVRTRRSLADFCASLSKIEVRRLTCKLQTENVNDPRVAFEIRGNAFALQTRPEGPAWWTRRRFPARCVALSGLFRCAAAGERREDHGCALCTALMSGVALC